MNMRALGVRGLNVNEHAENNSLPTVRPMPLTLVRSGAISFSDTAAKWYAARGRATSQCLAKLVSGGDGRRGQASDFPPFVP